MIVVEKIYQWLNILLGLPVLIEAFALFIGMNILVSEVTEWSTLKNNFLLLIDIITGIGIIYISFFKRELNISVVFYSLLLIILTTHLYREFEFFLNQPIKFAHNFPLFVVNGIKLALSVICFSLGIYIRRLY